MGQYGPSSHGNHGIFSRLGNLESVECRRFYRPERSVLPGTALGQADARPSPGVVDCWLPRRRPMGRAFRFDHHELGVRRGLSRGNRPTRTPVPS